MFLSPEKLSKALPEMEEIAKLLPDFDKIGENFTFIKSLLTSGELWETQTCLIHPPKKSHKTWWLNTFWGGVGGGGAITATDDDVVTGMHLALTSCYLDDLYGLHQGVEW